MTQLADALSIYCKPRHTIDDDTGHTAKTVQFRTFIPCLCAASTLYNRIRPTHTYERAAVSSTECPPALSSQNAAPCAASCHQEISLVHWPSAVTVSISVVLWLQLMLL